MNINMVRGSSWLKQDYQANMDIKATDSNNSRRKKWRRPSFECNISADLRQSTVRLSMELIWLAVPFFPGMSVIGLIGQRYCNAARGCRQRLFAARSLAFLSDGQAFRKVPLPSLIRPVVQTVERSFSQRKVAPDLSQPVRFDQVLIHNLRLSWSSHNFHRIPWQNLYLLRCF